MQIISTTGGIASTNCYLVADEVSKQAVLFDAPNDTVGPLLDEAKKRSWDLIGLWLTHGHFDHLADHAVVRKAFPSAKILIHKLDEPKLLHSDSVIFPLPFVIPPGKADAYVEDGEHLSIGSIDVRVIHTPGHSPGHVCYYLEKNDVLIGGDLIIMGSVGRTDLPDAKHSTLQASIRRVMELPGKTHLLGGHGGVTLLSEEARSNGEVMEAMGAG